MKKADKKTEKKSSRQKVPEAVVRFQGHLQKSGMDEKAVGFFLGRMMRMVTDSIAVETEKLFGQSGMQELSKITDPEKRLTKIDQKFLDKKQMTLFDFQSRVAEDIVRDFEAQK